MVECVDGSVIAQMSPNDMRFPILYALTYPDRFRRRSRASTSWRSARSTFAPLDPTRYPAVPLAYAALRTGGSAPAVLNAANEVAVEAFLEGRIPYPAIVETVARVLRATPRPARRVRRGRARGRRLGAARGRRPTSPARSQPARRQPPALLPRKTPEAA